MRRKTQNEKIIFGLKTRKFRLEQGLSFADMKRLTNLSVSYLNEIEKGKKYPKKDKIKIIAKALNVNMRTLTSGDLPRSLAPAADLLQSNFINELPLDIIGLDLTKIIEMIADAPSRVGAFVTTLLNLSRNYALVEEHFYFGALAAYLEMHNNYFPKLETNATDFAKQHKLTDSSPISSEKLARILETEYGYTIVEGGLKDYSELSKIRSLFTEKNKKLLLNERLSETQKVFQFAKELGFNYLNLKERAFTSSLLKVNSFEEVLSHFKAGYFAAALLINQSAFIKDLRKITSSEKWEKDLLFDLQKKYNASPETLFQRVTNLLPEFLGVKDIFFLRNIYRPSDERFKINRELHINQKHPPHSNGLREHYCRRWLSFSLFKKMKEEESDKISIEVQNSFFKNSGKEYFCITLAKKAERNRFVSVTIGILKDDNSLKKVNFLNDPIPVKKEVNTTCERCPIQNCESRVAPPSVIRKREHFKIMMETIDKISE